VCGGVSVNLLARIVHLLGTLVYQGWSEKIWVCNLFHFGWERVNKQQ
jgi:hypothetical protein